MTNHPGGFSISDSSLSGVNVTQGNQNQTIQGDRNQAVLGNQNQVHRPNATPPPPQHPQITSFNPPSNQTIQPIRLLSHQF